jgi:hypothetical protein
LRATPANDDFARLPAASPGPTNVTAEESLAFMKIRLPIFRSWIAVSALWMLGNGVWWYYNFADEQAQIAAVEECDEIYPPMPDGYVLDLYCRIPPCECSFPPCIAKLGTAAQAEAPATLLEKFDVTGHWRTWEEDQAKLHPQCAPKVGVTDFVDFVGMHASDRAALQQRSTDAMQALGTNALARAVAGPAGLLVIGLVFGWVARRRRSR